MLNLEEIKKSIVVNYNYFIERVKDVTPPNELFAVTEQMMKLRLDDLKIEKASIFDNSVEDYKYNGLTNSIIVNKKYLDRKDVFLENLYMDMALNVAFYNPKCRFSGFGSETFEALNKGIREMLVISLVDGCRSSEYFESDEYVYANLVSTMINPLDLQLAYYQNNPKIFMDKLDSSFSYNIEQFHEVNKLANHNMKNRIGKKSTSSLDKIQTDLFKLFLSQNPNKEQVERFLADTVSSSMIFKDEQKYERLDSLDFDNMYKDYVQSMETGKTY